jgi:hypothetical protein
MKNISEEKFLEYMKKLGDFLGRKEKVNEPFEHKRTKV